MTSILFTIEKQTVNYVSAVALNFPRSLVNVLKPHFVKNAQSDARKIKNNNFCCCKNECKFYFPLVNQSHCPLHIAFKWKTNSQSNAVDTFSIFIPSTSGLKERKYLDSSIQKCSCGSQEASLITKWGIVRLAKWNSKREGDQQSQEKKEL